jgi:hypothetical protein
VIILAGLWVALIGYDVLYTGVAKLSGDTSCTIGKAFRGQCSPGQAAVGGAQPRRGLTLLEHASSTRAMQLSTVPFNPVAVAT